MNGDKKGDKNGARIKNPGHLIYRRGFWMAYTAFSYASIISGALSTLISAVDFFDELSAGSLMSSPFHLIISIFFLAAGLMFLSARTFWGRLLLYTRKQDRQNELVINAKDVDDYRQKEAERDRQQLQQMDRTIEAAVERKMNDMDSRIENYTRMNVKMQKSFQEQYMAYLEDRLRKLDERFRSISMMTENKAAEAAREKEIREHLDAISFDRTAESNDDLISFEDAADNLGFSTRAADPEDGEIKKKPGDKSADNGFSDMPEPDESFPDEIYDESVFSEENPEDYLSEG